MNIEGSQEIRYEVGDDGRVFRVVSQFCGGSWVPLMAKPVAENVEQFKARYPGGRIANLVEQTVVRPNVMDVASKVREMSDAELAALGLQRKAPPAEGTRIPQDFPGDFALRRAGHTMESVRTLARDELVDIEGIGPATADKIIARLAEAE